jgi:hypothetical protein
VAPAALAAELHQLRELTPVFGIRTLRGSIIRAAEQALEYGDDETREVALLLLREVRKIPA